MSKKKYDYDYDDDYRGLGDFSDYDYYYGNPDRGNPDRDNARRGFSRRGKKSDLDYDDNINGSDREEAEVSSGVMYMLMAVCFGVLIISVLFGRMYVSNFVSPNNNTDFLFSSEVNAESEESEQVETVEQKIERELSSMTLEEKVGQLFMVRNNGSKGFKDTVSKTHAGAAILFAADFKGKTPAQVQKMIKGLQDASDGRMIIAVDEEGGDVIRVSGNTKLRKTKFLSPQKLYSQGGLELIKTDTEEKCELLDSLGINMNMAPVADVCTKSSAFMYKRSFGKGAEETAEYVSKVVGTMKATPVASCVKHFPGYGGSADTHRGTARDERPMSAFTEGAFLPFAESREVDFEIAQNPKQLGVFAFDAKPSRVVAQIGDHLRKLPLVKENRIDEAIGPARYTGGSSRRDRTLQPDRPCGGNAAVLRDLAPRDGNAGLEAANDIA